MKNSIKKWLRFLTTFITFASILFTVAFLAKILVDDVIFAQKTIAFRYIYLEIIAIVASSILLTLFYQINKITLATQVLVTYFVNILTIYFLGFISGWFSFKNLAFIIASLIVIILGALLILGITIFRKYLQQQKLNKELESFKEQDNHEKN